MNLLQSHRCLNFTFIFSDIAIEFGQRKSSGEISKQPAKRNKSSKKTTFNEDLVDLQKVQLNAIKESEKRQQDFMEIIIKQQQEQESREREAHRKLLLKLGKMLFSSK